MDWAFPYCSSMNTDFSKLLVCARECRSPPQPSITSSPLLKSNLKVPITEAAWLFPHVVGVRFRLVKLCSDPLGAVAVSNETAEPVPTVPPPSGWWRGWWWWWRSTHDGAEI